MPPDGLGTHFALPAAVIIERLEPASYDEWDQYVLKRRDSTCYHLRAWQTIAQNAYKLKTSFRIARETPLGPVCGILPLFIVPSIVRSHVTNGLFGAYGRILVETEAARLALLNEAMAIYHAEGACHLMLKCLDEPALPASLGLEFSDRWVIAQVDLEDDPERMWRKLRDKIRNCVRKAGKHGLEARIGKQYLPDFYEVLSANMHAKGAPVYGFPLMREILEAFRECAEVITIWDRERPVAGAIVLDHGDVTHVPFASSRPETLHMSPNNLLYWEVIRRGCLKGMKIFDFGRSFKNTGTLAFKLGWGARVIEQPSYLASSRGKTIRIDLKDRRVDWFLRQWARLPRPVVNRVGPAICRQLAGLI